MRSRFPRPFVNVEMESTVNGDISENLYSFKMYLGIAERRIESQEKFQELYESTCIATEQKGQNIVISCE